MYEEFGFPSNVKALRKWLKESEKEERYLWALITMKKLLLKKN